MSSALQESSRSELHPAVCIGHVHLRVADLDRAMSFYRDVLGFELTAYGADFGLPGAAFLAAGDYHHHIGLNTWHSQGGTPPPEGHTGLHHFAILYPDRRELARAVERLVERGYPIGGAEDHGATISVYLSDPDGNGIVNASLPRKRLRSEPASLLQCLLHSFALTGKRHRLGADTHIPSLRRRGSPCSRYL
jgi:catechol 2,3-dioxygenase